MAAAALVACLFIFFVAVPGAPGTAAAEPEVRGLWVVRDTSTTPEGVR